MRPRIRSMLWNIKNQKPTNQSKKKKESKQNEGSGSSLWDNFKRSNILIIRVPEGEEKEQEIGNLSEKIVKDEFPNLVKEIHMQVQKEQKVPNKVDRKSPTTRRIILKGQRLKRKRILKAARQKKLVTTGEFS